MISKPVIRKIVLLCSLLFLLGCNIHHKEKTPENDSLNISSRAPAVVTVDAPKSVSVMVDPKDSTWMKILLGKTEYRVSLLGDSLKTTKIGQVDQFFLTHMDRLNPDKILVIGKANLEYARFKELKAVLKKYALYKFRIQTTAD